MSIRPQKPQEKVLTLFLAVLPAMYPDEGDQLQQHMHLPNPASAT